MKHPRENQESGFSRFVLTKDYDRVIDDNDELFGKLLQSRDQAEELFMELLKAVKLVEELKGENKKLRADIASFNEMGLYPWGGV